MSFVQNPAKAISKHINVYIRRHPFVLSSIESFTTSQRRAFLRDVYDYARSLGLDKRESKQQTVKAREMCGEDEYDTDVSALENEIDDSEIILSRLRDPAYAGRGITVPRDSRVLSMSRQNSRSSMSDGATSQSQKRRKIDVGVEKKNTISSYSTIDTQRRTAANQSTNHVTKSKQVRDGNSSTASGEDRSSQRNGLPQNLLQQDSSTERELVLTTKPAPSYDPADPEGETDSQETISITSHSNTVAIASTTNFPATNLKNVETGNQNFIPPEVASFSDEEDTAAT